MSILDYGGDFAAGLMQGMRDYQAQQMQKQQWQNQLLQQTWDRNMSERELELRRRQLEQQAADADRRFTGDEADRRLREMQLQQQANPRLSLADLFKYVQGGAGIAPEFQKPYFDFGNQVAQQYNLPQFEGTQLQKAVDPNKRLDASVRLGLGVPRLQSVMGQENYNAAVPNFNQLGAMVNPEQPMTFNPQVGATPVEARNAETTRHNKATEANAAANTEIRRKQVNAAIQKGIQDAETARIRATRVVGSGGRGRSVSPTTIMNTAASLSAKAESLRNLASDPYKSAFMSDADKQRLESKAAMLDQQATYLLNMGPSQGQQMQGLNINLSGMPTQQPAAKPKPKTSKVTHDRAVATAVEGLARNKKINGRTAVQRLRDSGATSAEISYYMNNHFWGKHGRPKPGSRK